MISVRLKKRSLPPPFWWRVITPVLAILAALLANTPLVAISKVNPFKAFFYLIVSPLLSRYDLTEILVEALPLILTGLAVTIAFRAGYFNIGAEGQLYAGAITAAWAGVALGNWPKVILIPTTILIGMAAGSLWSLIPRLLRNRVDEALSTLLFNPVMIHLTGALLSTVWLDPVTKWPKSPEIGGNARLPIIVGGSRVSLGLPIALLLALALFWLLRSTSLGFEIRTVGLNPKVARYAGMNEGRIITLVALLSGGLAGLAGVFEVLGKHGHLIREISPGFGYTGIAVATLVNLNPLAIPLGAVFIGILNLGAMTMQRLTQTPAALAGVAQATMLLAMVAISSLNTFTVEIKRRRDG